MNLTILTCNYNTPKMTLNLLRSLKLTNKQLPDILVINTGDNGSDHDDLRKIVNCYDCGNTSHGNAVNIGFDLIQTDYILLVDSDVIFLDDISKPFNIFKDKGLTLMGHVTGDRGGKSIYNRVDPWFCFMDLKKLKQWGIKFYDHERTKVTKSSKIYDIGSSMFEDVINCGGYVGDCLMEGKYFKHYEGMSWRVQKYNPLKPDTDIDVGGTHPNKSLYEYGLYIQECYNVETKDIENINIEGIFK
jgi:glycosyltransferase involved in cell wall biosynthesis